MYKKGKLIMTGHWKYELEDRKDVEKLNRLLRPSGISVQYNLFGLYVLVDTDLYKSFSRKKTGQTRKKRQRSKSDAV